MTIKIWKLVLGKRKKRESENQEQAKAGIRENTKQE